MILRFLFCQTFHHKTHVVFLCHSRSKAYTSCNLYGLQRSLFFKILHTVVLGTINSQMALSWFSWTANEGLPHIFYRLNPEHKVDPGVTAVRYTASFNEPIVPRYNSHSLGWFFCDTWFWIFSERKREIAIRETTNNTVHAPHRHTTPWWLAGFLSSSARVQCHLAVWMKIWILGATFGT